MIFGLVKLTGLYLEKKVVHLFADEINGDRSGLSHVASAIVLNTITETIEIFSATLDKKTCK